jgi:DNA-binding transcriptional ArsR family regulator
MPREPKGTGQPLHMMILVEDIELDRTNPRIKKWVEMYPDGAISEDRLELALLADTGDESDAKSTTVDKLRKSILMNNGIVTPIVVNVKDGRMICIEGNTRVFLYRSFAKQYPDDERWKSIPALVYHDLSEAAIDAIRLQVHLVGPRAWDAYSKAKYLHYLRNQEHLTWSEIVDYSGGRQREVEEQIVAYEEMELWYRDVVGDGNFDTSRFSGFVELQAKDVKRAIADAGFSLVHFATWIHERKLMPLWHIRQLPRILKHDEARRVFLKSGSKLALQQLERPDVVKSLMDADIMQLSRALSARVQKVNIGELSAIRSNNGAQDLAEARDAIKMLLGILRSPELLEGEDDE